MSAFWVDLSPPPKKDYQASDLLNEIDPVAWAPIYSVFTETFKPFNVGRIAPLQTD